MSLTTDGGRVAIGGPRNGNGHVRIYDLVGGVWTQVGSDINGEASGDKFGTSVSISSDGSRVAIGAPKNDGNGSNSGHVRIYDLVGGIWVQSGVDIEGGGESGTSVSLTSDCSYVAIGAPLADGNGSNSGTVRVYSLSGGGGGGGDTQDPVAATQDITVYLGNRQCIYYSSRCR